MFFESYRHRLILDFSGLSRTKLNSVQPRVSKPFGIILNSFPNATECAKSLIVTKLDRLGRPSSLTAEQQETIHSKRKQGASLGKLAKEYGVSRSAIQRAERQI